MVFLELLRDAWDSFPVALATSGNISFCLRKVMLPFRLLRHVGIPLTRCRGIGPHFEFESFNRGARPRLILRHGTPLSHRVLKGVSGLMSS